MKNKGWNRVLKGTWRSDRRNDTAEANDSPPDDLPLVEHKMRPKNKVIASPRKPPIQVLPIDEEKEISAGTMQGRFINSLRRMKTVRIV